MKRSTLFAAALLVSLAPIAMATPAIQKDAQKKDPKVTCKTCHSSLPGSKTNLTDEGKKWAK
jgi:hypothetical protein